MLGWWMMEAVCWIVKWSELRVFAVGASEQAIRLSEFLRGSRAPKEHVQVHEAPCCEW